MAKHLIIGDGTAFGLTAGLVNDGAISIQKRSASGPTELVLGDTMANAPEIRILSGGSGGKNNASPWFYGRDVINYTGRSYAAPAAHSHTLTATGTSGAVPAGGSFISLKFVRKGGPSVDIFSFTTQVAAGVANTAVDLVIEAAYLAARKPDWLNPAVDVTGGTTVIFAGALRGDVAQSGNVWEEGPVIFDVIIEEMTVVTQTFALNAMTTPTTTAAPGYGDGFAVKYLEEVLMGNQYGYYNRIAQPITPAAQAVTGTTYDMYAIAATKDGSSYSQINGVDNLIEVDLAVVAGDADSLVVENKLNAYFAGAFPNVIL